MNQDPKTDLALAALTGVLLVSAFFFVFRTSGEADPAPEVSATPRVFTEPATVRLSARALIEAEEDVSGMMCYSCHDAEKKLTLVRDADGVVMASTNHLDLVYSRMNCAGCHRAEEGVELKWDDDDNLIIPAAHRQPPMRHGRFGRNNDCFICHIPDKLDKLRTLQGQVFDLKDSTLLCAGCHGPSYREWERGMHGRRNGHWETGRGEVRRLDCTSCHDPHSPAFPRMIPGPAPKPLRVAAGVAHEPNAEVSHE